MGKTTIGTIASLSVRCLSELAWHDNARMRMDFRDGGGPGADQFDVKWTPGNAAGVSSLVEAVDAEGRTRRILMDTGWDTAYMDEVFRREGVDRLLAGGGIEALYVTHEHLDHFWGLPVVARYAPGIRLLVPAGISARSRALIAASGHTGPVEEMSADGPHILFPGCASVTFDMPIFLKTRGEQVLYFNVAGKGIVTVTGCCHPGVIALLDRARELFEDAGAFHGIYGGLHIAPFEEWGPDQDALLAKLAGYGVRAFA